MKFHFIKKGCIAYPARDWYSNLTDALSNSIEFDIIQSWGYFPYKWTMMKSTYDIDITSLVRF